MSKETGKQRVGGNIKILKDPGNVLIVVYIMIIIFLLLVGNLANASADRAKTDTISSQDRLQRVELLLKAY